MALVLDLNERTVRAFLYPDSSAPHHFCRFTHVVVCSCGLFILKPERFQPRKGYSENTLKDCLEAEEFPRSRSNGRRGDGCGCRGFPLLQPGAAAGWPQGARVFLVWMTLSGMLQKGLPGQAVD